MATTDEKEALLNRARDYPYWAPSQSYVWDPDDDPRDLQPFDPELTEGRWPVLAVGSNRSPEQLARKKTPSVRTLQQIHHTNYTKITNTKYKNYQLYETKIMQKDLKRENPAANPSHF